MEPENDFLENASMMIDYAKKEIKQFMDWTNRRTVYGATAESIASDLEELLNDVKRLKREYASRERAANKTPAFSPRQQQA
ncbi:hypothetical protein MUN82_05290 [Hymenobacter aerilatus]|uniref:Uncharacterized protein n=1 Tax=Hymenobacter aerilatus TaxID=2932251 RepID=A0A8T9SWP4_9BACT|nr:hypothetical protein [Hymenobacter aerilatus]UOR06508.1 hypothetical protein MUN82_05290 [Hymenobacter aerilatus]